MKTQIIYEDNEIIVCYKPAGIAVQSAGLTQQDMVSELKNYLGNPYLGVIHRLDQPVSGIVVFAKNQKAAASLSSQVQNGGADKIYRALVCGCFEEGAKEGILEHILYKDAKSNMSKVVLSGGKKAKLEYKVLEERETDGHKYSELEIKLYTGRHHQIRVQMAASGHPILGDTKYGHELSKTLNDNFENKNLKLCAYRLSFRHPKTNKTVTFEVPVKPWQENCQ